MLSVHVSGISPFLTPPSRERVAADPTGLHSEKRIGIQEHRQNPPTVSITSGCAISLELDQARHPGP